VIAGRKQNGPEGPSARECPPEARLVTVPLGGLHALDVGSTPADAVDEVMMMREPMARWHQLIRDTRAYDGGEEIEDEPLDILSLFPEKAWANA
jgi:hypothetical protein